MPRCLAPTTVFLTLLVLAAHARATPVSFAASAEFGPELDTNALRVDDNDPTEAIAAPLLRAAVGLSLSVPFGAHRIDLAYRGGAKLFLRDAARSSDELVQRAAFAWVAQLKRLVGLGLQGSYYDSFQRQEQPASGQTADSADAASIATRRDFRSGTALLLMDLGRGDWDTVPGIHVGYRGLQYKPLSDFNFHALLAGLALRHDFHVGSGDLAIDWSVSATYGFALRFFQGEALMAPGELRRDVDQVARVAAGYIGFAEASLWYAFEHNASNSYGETYIRHVLGLKFTVPLMWGVYMSTQGVFQISQFADRLFGGLVTQTFDIEEENRSRFMLYLARDISRRWTASLRYTIYVNESATTSEGVSTPGFLRHTLFLGARFEYDSRD